MTGGFTGLRYEDPKTHKLVQNKSQFSTRPLDIVGNNFGIDEVDPRRSTF
jgi:hypothetical protein